MPPADDQQNVNPVNPVDVQPQGMPPATPPAADDGQMPMQPTVISPTAGPSDDLGSPAIAAPGFGSTPDGMPADNPAPTAPSSFDTPSMPADVSPAAPAADEVPSVPPVGDVPPVAPGTPADAPDASVDAPTFPPAA